MTSRVLVVGTGTPLGDAVADRFHRRADAELVDDRRNGDGYDAVHALVAGQHVDAVVHTAMIRWQPRLDADVIETMRLAAALADPACTVRTVVAASSAAAYSASSRAPRLRREDEILDPPVGTVAARVLEAERYLRVLAGTHPHMCVALLRLADLSSPAPGPLADLLGRSVVPAVPGFDPPVQLLDVDDAAAALEHAVEHSLAGVYNVAGAGTCRWAEVTRLARRSSIPVLAPPSWVPLPALGPLLPDRDTLETLRFGRAVDTARIAATGFQPSRTTADCASAISATGPGRRRHPGPDSWPFARRSYSQTVPPNHGS